MDGCCISAWLSMADMDRPFNATRGVILDSSFLLEDPREEVDDTSTNWRFSLQDKLMASRLVKRIMVMLRWHCEKCRW